MNSSLCRCDRAEGQLHQPGCEALAESYANAIYLRGIFRARDSGVVDGLTGRPIDDSPLFQSVAEQVEARLRTALQREEMGAW
jgi:hypothetical protein